MSDSEEELIARAPRPVSESMESIGLDETGEDALSGIPTPSTSSRSARGGGRSDLGKIGGAAATGSSRAEEGSGEDTERLYGNTSVLDRSVSCLPLPLVITRNSSCTDFYQLFFPCLFFSPTGVLRHKWMPTVAKRPHSCCYNLLRNVTTP